MALYDRWTRAQLRGAVRERLADPTGRWWTDAKLNDYIDDWQRELNSKFEFIWGTYTITTATSSFTLATIMPGYHGVGRAYCDGAFTPYMDSNDLHRIDRTWRDQVGDPPICVWQPTRTTIQYWPTSTETHTYSFEFPTVSTFATDTSTHEVPAWTRYSCIPYCMWRAYSAQGPNHDVQKALRYKAKFTRFVGNLTRTWDSYFPASCPHLKPGGRFERRLLSPFRTVLELPWRM